MVKYYKTGDTTELTIITNNQSRDLLSWYDLTTQEKEYYLSLMEEDGLKEMDFFKYKGDIYLLSDFMIIDCNSPLSDTGWEGYSSDSFFSGIVIKYAEYDNDKIIIGRYQA